MIGRELLVLYDETYEFQSIATTRRLIGQRHQQTCSQAFLVGHVTSMTNLDVVTRLTYE